MKIRIELNHDEVYATRNLCEHVANCEGKDNIYTFTKDMAPYPIGGGIVINGTPTDEGDYVFNLRLDTRVYEAGMNFARRVFAPVSSLVNGLKELIKMTIKPEYDRMVKEIPVLEVIRYQAKDSDIKAAALYIKNQVPYPEMLKAYLERDHYDAVFFDSDVVIPRWTKENVLKDIEVQHVINREHAESLVETACLEKAGWDRT